MRIEERTLEAIRERMDLAVLAGSLMTLKPSGNTLKGLCPFHSEKTPSFHIYPEKQIFKCYGCGAGGDVFSFVMKRDGLPFTDAVLDLARRAGIPVTQGTEADPFEKKREVLFKILEESAAWFQERLSGEAGARARDYLVRRGLTRETIQLFRLGYAPSGPDTYVREFRRLGYDPGALVEAGMILPGKTEGGFRDRFWNRVIFPVSNPSGRTCGFSGRSLEASNPAKYLNSPETPVFKKNQLLYGLAEARAAIRSRGEVLLAEGHLDVALLHQHGWTQTVGLQGTAFNPAHARLLARYARNLVLIFDGDEAGFNAAIRVLPIGLAAGLTLEIVMLPVGEDPASLLQTKGAPALQAFYTKKRSLFEVKMEWLAKHQGETPEGKAKIIGALVPDLQAVTDSVLADAFLQTLSHRFDIRREAIQTLLQRSAASPEAVPIGTPASGAGVALPVVERELLGLAVFNPEVHGVLMEQLDLQDVSQPVVRSILKKVFLLASERAYHLDALQESLKGDPAALDCLERLEPCVGGEALRDNALDLIRQASVQSLQRRMQVLQGRIRDQKDPEVLHGLLAEFDSLNQKRKVFQS